MSKQVKSIAAYPLGRNTIKIETDQDDYALDEGENKILTRTPDHFPVNKNTIHAHVKDGYGNIIEVLDLDPLQIKVSGYSERLLDGYDGLVVNADGTAKWRGVIRTSSNLADLLYNSAYYSDGDNHWLIGGTNLREDGYVNTIFHSIDAVSYELQDTPPFSARANSLVLGDGNGNVWLVGGSDATGYKQDIWHGVINYGTGIIGWDGGALVSSQSELNKYIKNGGYGTFNQPVLFINDLVFNLGSNTFSAIGALINELDGYGNTKFFDQTRNIYHNSNDSVRREVIYDAEGAVTDVVGNPFGYTHLQDTSSAAWSFTHNLDKSSEVVVVCYDSDYNLLGPSSISVSNKDITVNLAIATAGRAFVLDGYTMASGATWVVDGYDIDSSAIWCCDDNYNLLEPASITRDSATQFTLTWNVATAGNISVLGAYQLGSIRGRRYVSAATNFTSGVNTIEAEQFSPSVFNLRNASYELVQPSAMSMDSDGSNFTMNSSATVKYGAMFLRHDGYNDVQEPYDFEYCNIGYNTQNNATAYILGDRGVWRSATNGASWIRRNGENLQLPTDRLVPVLANNSVVGTINLYYLTTNSITSGNTWSDPGNSEIGLTIVTFYGPLTDQVTDAWRFFAYERPADVIWEQHYGAFPETLLDDYSTNYVLPYPAVVTSDDSQNIQFVLDTDYGRATVKDEFKNDWVYLFDDDGYVVEKQIIVGNTTAAAGASVSVYTHEFAQAPTIGDKIQIIKTRPEGTNYYSLLTRNETLFYDIYTEDDGTAFIESQEKVYDYYAHRKMLGTLPEYISTDDNNAKLDLLQTELDRARVVAGQSYNDPYAVPPEFLDRLGLQLGIDASGLPLKTQRRAIANWYTLVDGYGWCLDGLNNIRQLILGSDSQTVISVSNPSGDVLAGKVTNISISSDSSNHWDYVSAVNTIKWDTDVDAWYMSVASEDIVSQIKTLKNTYLVHFNKNAVDGPFRIVDHVYNDVNDTYSIYFDDPLVFDIAFVEGSSVLAIYNKDQRDRVFKFIDIISKSRPHWSMVSYS